MNRRNILLYTLAGVFSIIGALTNGISPFLAGSPAAEKIGERIPEGSRCVWRSY